MAGNAMLERLWWLFPLLAVPFSYLLYVVTKTGGWWLLLRLNVAALIGLGFCLHRVTSAIDYSDSRNSGVFAGFALGLALGVLLLTICDIVVVVVLLLNRRSS